MNYATLTPAQCRAARALIGWSRDQAANAAKVAERTLVDFENGTRSPRDSTLTAIRGALEAAGVIFIDQNGNGPGVRLRDRSENEGGIP